MNLYKFNIKNNKHRVLHRRHNLGPNLPLSVKYYALYPECLTNVPCYNSSTNCKFNSLLSSRQFYRYCTTKFLCNGIIEDKSKLRKITCYICLFGNITMPFPCILQLSPLAVPKESSSLLLASDYGLQ